jgi:hypothetical protein
MEGQRTACLDEANHGCEDQSKKEVQTNDEDAFVLKKFGLISQESWQEHKREVYYLN